MIGWRSCEDGGRGRCRAAQGQPARALGRRQQVDAQQLDLPLAGIRQLLLARCGDPALLARLQRQDRAVGSQRGVAQRDQQPPRAAPRAAATRITSSIGWTAARPASITWCCCAGAITAPFTRAWSTCAQVRMARSPSCVQMAWCSNRCPVRRCPSRASNRCRNRSAACRLGTARPSTSSTPSTCSTCRLSATTSDRYRGKPSAARTSGKRSWPAGGGFSPARSTFGQLPQLSPCLGVGGLPVRRPDPERGRRRRQPLAADGELIVSRNPLGSVASKARVPHSVSCGALVIATPAALARAATASMSAAASI
jgi:hypothetical protein